MMNITKSKNALLDMAIVDICNCENLSDMASHITFTRYKILEVEKAVGSGFTPPSRKKTECNFLF